MGKVRPEIGIVATVADIVTAQLSRWGGTALTGRDISLDMANLDLTLTALRDALLTGTVAYPGGIDDVYNKLNTQLDALLSTRATEATLAKSMPTIVTKYVVALTLADTEYSQALTNVKKFRIHTRDFTAFRLAYVTGKVAGSVDPYETIPAGSEKYEDSLNIASLTLFFASSTAGKTAEIEAWS